MLTFLLLLGFFSIVFIPMICMLYVEAKNKCHNSKRVWFWLSFIPGICIFMLYGFLKPDPPPVLPSKACGVIQFYQVHKTRGGSFERISIRFDDAQYSRHLLFDEHLSRPQKAQHVCFEYLNKLEYPQLSESKLVKWIEH